MENKRRMFIAENRMMDISTTCNLSKTNRKSEKLPDFRKEKILKNNDAKMEHTERKIKNTFIPFLSESPKKMETRAAPARQALL